MNKRAGKGVSTPKKKSKYNPRAMRLVLNALTVSVLISLLLGAAIYYMVTHPYPRTFYSTTTNGRISPLVGLNQPNQSDPAVLQWAAQAAISAHNYNFVSFQEQLDHAATYFTKRGWEDFRSALIATNSVDTVIAKQLIVSAVATAKPVILAKGLVNDAFFWRVQMPLLVTYQSPSDFSQEKVVVTLLIRRISTLKSPKGIGIDQFIVTPIG